ncbi:hypothetical protein GTY65_33745 [Streptomyces sp. SID8379]|uniref:hypothetical protein n=1 Tax=unclassified Streptomyces TaxID=2593676 RepID=UPI00036DEBB5|nr:MULTISPECIES: hypothetical protein [unclassified Streptomyces]MYW69003.1 hypothetical protein [Streptomyces sp. SID8379]
MDTFDLVLVLLCAAAAVVYVIAAVAAIAGQRLLLPWQRGRVRRPRMWGWGALLQVVFFGAVALQLSSEDVWGGLPLAGLLFLFAGIGLFLAAERPPKA